MMTEFMVTVTQEVSVRLDETKFTPEFMKEFSDNFYGFNTLEDHAKHLAQLGARGIFSERFIEGYGEPQGMGIVVDVEDCYQEIE